MFALLLGASVGATDASVFATPADASRAVGDWARAAGGRRLRLGERGRETWRPGLTPDKVADIVFAIASPDTLRALIDLCGWKRNAAETLIVQTLERELLGQ